MEVDPDISLARVPYLGLCTAARIEIPSPNERYSRYIALTEALKF
jgi:hypothetical protein